MTEIKKIYSLGGLIFETHKIDLEGVSQNLQFNWEELRPFARGSSSHFTGFNESISFEATIDTKKTGLNILEETKEKAKKGEVFTLIDNEGKNLGDFALLNLKVDPNSFIGGIPGALKINLDLRRVFE